MNKLLIFILFITTLLHAQIKEVTLVLPWKHQFQFAGYYMAKEMGFYKKMGINVRFIENNIQGNSAQYVSTQKYEFGVGHSSLILEKLNNYPNIRFLAAIHQSSPLVLLAKKRLDLQTIEDFKDKKIMITQSEGLTAGIKAMIYSQQLSPDSYEIISTLFNPLDLLSGKIDLMSAYISNEPYTLLQKGIQYTIFDPRDYGYDFYSDILFTSKEMIQNDPKLVKAFYEASMMGWVYAYKHIDESVDVILKHYNTQNKTKKALLYEANTLKKLAFIKDIDFGNINQIRLKEIITTYRLLGLIKKETQIDFDTFIFKLPIANNLFIMNDKKKALLFQSIYEEYKLYIRIALLIFTLLLIVILYFRYRMKKLLQEQLDELHKNNEIFDKNISSSRTDINGTITHVSQAFCHVSGYSKEELLGKNHNLLKAQDTPNEIYKDMWLSISCGHIWSGELKNIKKDGSLYWVKAIISPLFDKNNKIIAYEAIRQDITLKKVLEDFNENLEHEVQLRTAELAELAITDKLTGLYNRTKLDEVLSSCNANFTRYHNVYSIAIIDIDFFKKVNDNYGHNVGDDILQQVSSIMKDSTRSTDILGRWGGEEFLIISANTDLDGMKKLAEHIRLKIERTDFDDVGKITISAGLAQIHPSMSTKDIMIKADKALYKAKEEGRNRIEA